MWSPGTWGRLTATPFSPDTVGGDPMGLPYSTFDHSRAHYFRYDEHVSLCLEKQR